MKYATIRLPDKAIELIIEALMEYEAKTAVEEDALDVLIPFFEQLEYDD